MAVSRGKRWERVIKELFEKDGIHIERLPDNTAGFRGVANPSDFIAYYNGRMIYIEAKFRNRPLMRFTLSDITKTQRERSIEYSEKKGIHYMFIMLSGTDLKVYCASGKAVAKAIKDGLPSVPLVGEEAYKAFEVDIFKDRRRLYPFFSPKALLDKFLEIDGE